MTPEERESEEVDIEPYEDAPDVDIERSAPNGAQDDGSDPEDEDAPFFVMEVEPDA